ncbi:MAG: FAD-binding oxidoreductase [Chloroflexota bacterium]|nr:FAD-binding oxidoreductase [Chloroflexota bacterium]
MAARTRYESWGRYPTVVPRAIVPIRWRAALPDLASLPASVLPYAYGRSYGDSCLNAGGIALDVTGLRRFIAFDAETGTLQCEAGVLLADILDQFVPRGWFLPVSPGTKYVSVGGAIANDIHGKNHHRAGTFGRHVARFELVRSSGDRLLCSPDEHADIYRATIGGLGLTGLITWAEIRLKPITNAYIDEEQIRFDSLDEFLALTAASDATHEYTMSWADCLFGGKGYVRGHFIRGNHNTSPELADRPPPHTPSIGVPVDLPGALLNTWTVKAFNTAYFHRQRAQSVRHVIPYDPFFYPLDAIKGWNRMYGARGFLQYQCVVPFNNDNAAIKEIFTRITHSGEGSFLVVLKTFGDLPSPGLLSFPRPGITLALDFPFHGARTLQLLEDLDGVVRASGGAVYPAKDARMSVESFAAFFPQWRGFACHMDPQFSSSFWRRVTRTTR